MSASATATFCCRARASWRSLLGGGRETRNVTTFVELPRVSGRIGNRLRCAGSVRRAPCRRRAGRGRVALPIGLPVTLALVAPIDTATAAAGDPVAAKVVKPVRRPGSRRGTDPGRRGGPRPHSPRGTPPVANAVFSDRAGLQPRGDTGTSCRPSRPAASPTAELARELGANLAIRARPESGSGTSALSCFPPARAAS